MYWSTIYIFMFNRSDGQNSQFKRIYEAPEQIRNKS